MLAVVARWSRRGPGGPEEKQRNVMVIEIIAGDFGRCEASIEEHAFLFPETILPFSQVAEIAVLNLDMVHSSLAPKGVVLAQSIFCLARPIAGNAWGSDVMEVTFRVTTVSGEHFLAKTDTDTFVALKEDWLALPG